MRYFRNAFQPTYTCSKLRMKKKQFVKYVQNEQQRQQNKVIDVLLMTFLLIFYINFTHCSNVSILNFKQRNELAHSSHSQYNEKSMSHFFFASLVYAPYNIFIQYFLSCMIKFLILVFFFQKYFVKVSKQMGGMKLMFLVNSLFSFNFSQTITPFYISVRKSIRSYLFQLTGFFLK